MRLFTLHAKIYIWKYYTVLIMIEKPLIFTSLPLLDLMYIPTRDVTEKKNIQKDNRFQQKSIAGFFRRASKRDNHSTV